MDDSGWPAGGMELVLKDVRKNIEKGLATAKEEWEVALKRGDNWKPLEQVRQRVQQHEPLQNTYTARAARSNAVARHESFGSGAAPPFVPWRGWDELESMSRELRQKGEASLREMSQALSSGLEANIPAGGFAGSLPGGGPGLPRAFAKRSLPRVASDSALQEGRTNNHSTPAAFDEFPALEQLRAVAASAAAAVADSTAAAPFGRRRSSVGDPNPRWGISDPQRSQSTSDLQSAEHDAEVALRGSKPSHPSVEGGAERRSLGCSPEAKPASSRRKHSGRRSESDATGFSLSAAVAGEPMLDPRRWAVAPSDPGRETLAAEHTEEPEPNNKLAVFLRELQRGMKQNGEKSQALVQGLVRDLQSHLDQHMPISKRGSMQDLTELAADTPAAGGEDGRSLHVGGGKAAAAAEGGGAALQTLRRRARGGRAHEEAAAAAGAAPSSIRDEGRSFAIVTTASLPWMTGTAVNPLLRAAYLSQVSSRNVTLVVPFLPHADQAKLFPNGQVFERPEELEGYIKKWVTQRVGFAPGDNFKISFYPGRYSPRYGCVFSVGDITQYIPDKDADVAVLEEPEHLNWFHSGARWTEKFKHVVGVVHTNYLEYAKREEGGGAKEVFMRHVNSLMCRFHCHKVVKLSGAVQDLPKSMTEFVHGVSPHFLAVGDRLCADAAAHTPALTFGSLSLPQPAPPLLPASHFSKGVYFIGKVLWPKGYSELVDLVHEYKQHNADGGIQMDVYGGGEDLPAVKQTATAMGLGMHFMGPKDHGHEDIHQYKVFVNPSLSDVVATTTAEALAMGKFVVVAKHPSNEFFSSFDNCLVYDTKEQFIQCLDTALASEPKPLSADERYRLTWEAATERFLDVAEIPSKAPNAANDAVDALGSMVYSHLSGSEAVRRSVGNPDSLDVVRGDLGEWAARTRSMESTRGETLDPQHKASKR